MSWVAHDLEPYVFQRKLGKGAAISFVALVLGSWGPDLVTKWFVYGTNVVGFHLKAADPSSSIAAGPAQGSPTRSRSASSWLSWCTCSREAPPGQSG
jgi:hypothetical protein